MKQAIYTKTGSRQLIDSGWKEFDRQTNCISTGNVLANTQMSSCIRPWKETECNGFDFEEGHLMKYDLSPYLKFRIPNHIKGIIRDKERDKGVILYMFFTRNKYGSIAPFCWVLTDYNYKLLADVLTLRCGERFSKRANARDEILSYITK